MNPPTEQTVRTRICLISDTHTNAPSGPQCTSNPYRYPFPKADILLHAGDITRVGRKSEHEQMLSMLKEAPAELKIVIAGNHDITHDEEYYNRVGYLRHRRPGTDFELYPGGGETDDKWRENPQEIRQLYTSPDAQGAGIVYLDECLKTFSLSNGASFTLYASPYTPEFCQWAFAYDPAKEDRFNPNEQQGQQHPSNPIPDFPDVDILLTHGPPQGIFDEVSPSGEHVGCPHLLRAVKRAKPRLHVFGHIHEGYGAGRMNWASNALDEIRSDPEERLEQRCAYYNASGGSVADAWSNLKPSSNARKLVHGEETLFVNASVVTVAYRATNAPWVVDLDLPAASGGGRGRNLGE
ncbi:hypothetical protein MPDQ_002990 [Monascus purpureus]|uniref:Calcineurin-like phosphoesterase domain-containing protein n=1 Tax=Monascus purpureus TaxID=5098 RepID=A0A507R6G2_MONPU|nr:hypothetical protein MPDQ_002990 [Monascus purpureus]